MGRNYIVQATLHEMQFLLATAKAEGWNPGLDDAISFYYTDPTGFFIEKIGEDSIGCISAVAYDNTYGFMGFYVVLPSFRGQGYGIKLWDHAIQYLGNRTIGLDGVVAQQENYKKSGFKFYYNNIRFKGTVKGKQSRILHSLDTVPFLDLVAYDSSIFGVNRNLFLQHWITSPHSHNVAKIVGRSLAGYGVMRKCEIGYKIGPLFADTTEVAEEIFLALASQSQGDELFLDVVQTNQNALDLVEKYDFHKVFETARMYKGDPPPQLLSRVFGVTTFELG